MRLDVELSSTQANGGDAVVRCATLMSSANSESGGGEGETSRTEGNLKDEDFFDLNSTKGSKNLITLGRDGVGGSRPRDLGVAKAEKLKECDYCCSFKAGYF
ncbi:uncharacterized protein EAE97_009967 [Botrytis byssoidea]|uniref:Uncharacterized protein n=1 Tax=Botrytis byssoidea TaxID=139641 RepID=A0A9P5LP72_9HELO|nr:uncharacterized protein EAE97_009967 [Botrytis byssoidea]KAF7927292.1 hypothetical protein EAE97_009967 [Botrytis byssoidea]